MRLSPDATRWAYGSRWTPVSYLDTTPLTGFGADPLVNISEIGEEAMNIALWMVQIVLALFIAVGSFVFVPVG